jgi:hypothetical protein
MGNGDWASFGTDEHAVLVALPEGLDFVEVRSSAVWTAKPGRYSSRSRHANRGSRSRCSAASDGDDATAPHHCSQPRNCSAATDAAADSRSAARTESAIRRIVVAAGGYSRLSQLMSSPPGRSTAPHARLTSVSEPVGIQCSAVAASTASTELAVAVSPHPRSSAPALRFGDPRVMALAAALCALVHAVVGFTNRSLCARVSPPLGGLYTSAQMTYDLPRLRRKGLIRRIERTNRYLLTPTAPARRSSTPSSTNGCSAPSSPPKLRPPTSNSAARSRSIDHTVDDYISRARIKAAA